MNKGRFKHVDYYERYGRHRTLREVYMHNRMTIDAWQGAAFALVLILGAITAVVGWKLGNGAATACGSFVALAGGIGWVAGDAGRG